MICVEMAGDRPDSPIPEALLRALEERRGDRERTIVALDGRCAAGKTTLARQLHDGYGWSVIHMDHFFLRPEQRTPERYRTPGENIDHERFLQEVLLPLRRGEKGVVYHPFDCSAGRLGDPIETRAAPVIIVEGSYACHKALWEHYDLRVFLTVDAEEQRRRIAARDGAERTEVFLEKWIPLEEQYIAAYRLESRCDLRLEMGRG